MNKTQQAKVVMLELRLYLRLALLRMPIHGSSPSKGVAQAGPGIDICLLDGWVPQSEPQSSIFQTANHTALGTSPSAPLSISLQTTPIGNVCHKKRILDLFYYPLMTSLLRPRSDLLIARILHFVQTLEVNYIRVTFSFSPIHSTSPICFAQVWHHSCANINMCVMHILMFYNTFVDDVIGDCEYCTCGKVTTHFSPITTDHTSLEVVPSSVLCGSAAGRIITR